MAKQIERVSPEAAHSAFSPPLVVNGVLTVLLCSLIAATICYGQDLNSFQRWVLILFLFLSAFAGFGYGFWQIRRQQQKLPAAPGKIEFAWTQMSPEQQRLKLNLEIMMIADRLQMSGQHEDLRAAYMIAEDLALRKIELDQALSLRRHVVLENAPFDAAAQKADKIYCVEVTFLVSPEISPARVEAIFNKLAQVARRLREAESELKPHLLLALVTQLTPPEETEMRRAVKKLFAAPPVDADVFFMDFENLQTVFTAE